MKATMVIVALLAALAPAAAQGPRLPDGFSEAVYENGLDDPTSMAFAPDGRLFVTEQGGSVRVIDAGGTLLGPDFTSFTVDDYSERGLLGLAFDPNFEGNGYVYVYYTTPDGPRNRVDRITANGNQAVLGSGVKLFQLPKLSSAGNHNGGAIHFGVDGKLYVAVGENANPSLAQSMSTRMGKMLRYNRDGSIPSDNPFYGSASGSNRAIWALGLRNPFTFAVQPGTGTIFINDVGAGSWEEINLGEAGANYGWPATEGHHGNPAYENPLYAYANDASTCAIAGGAFYNPSTPMFPPSYTGDYFFADLCAGEIYVRDPGGDVTTFADPTAGGGIVDIDIGPDGALYYLSRGSGAVYRIGYQPDPVEGELIQNGSFENDSNGDGIPNGWSASANLKAKQKCGAPQATDGSCALLIKRRTGAGKVKQNIDDAYALAPSTSLDVSADVAGKNVAEGASIHIKLVTQNGPSKFVLPIPTGTYDPQNIAHPTIVTDSQGKKLKIKIKYPDGGGKMWIDQMSVEASLP